MEIFSKNKFGFYVVRVHPNQIKRSGSKWRLPVAVTLFLLVMGAIIMRHDGNRADASFQYTLKSVLVVKNSIPAGAQINTDYLVREKRPISTLPEDSITTLEEIQGKFALGPIPAGYPLSASLLVESFEDDESLQVTKEQLADKRLASISKDTVGISVNFESVAPSRGDRIALSIRGESGKSVLVADEVWVEESSQTWSRLRVTPATALFLEEAKEIGLFSYFVINEEGPNPFREKAIQDIRELKKQLSIIDDNDRQVASSKPEEEKSVDFSGYAWVTGKGVKYSVGENGKIYILGADGQAKPIHGEAPASVKEESQTKKDKRVETGLEPLYPVAGVE